MLWLIIILCNGNRMCPSAPRSRHCRHGAGGKWAGLCGVREGQSASACYSYTAAGAANGLYHLKSTIAPGVAR
jgi:hypothetical protein